MTIFDNLAIMLIILSLVAIIVIIARKLSVLANLNVEQMRSEKEVKFKEQIIGKRLKRNFTKWTSRFVRTANDGASLVGGKIGKFYDNLIKYREEQKAKAGDTLPVEIDDKEILLKVEILINDAEKLRKDGDLADAEKKLIEAIGADSRNIKAFKALGQLYFDKDELDEAKQTFEHIIRLIDDIEYVHALDAESRPAGAKTEHKKRINANMERGLAFFNLALVMWKNGKLDDSIRELRKALAAEPNNPRYLDSLIEISIINKDKITALTAYETLSSANPENNKLPEFKRQIDEL